MEQRELLMHFMRSLKTKGLLDMDIHGSVVDVFIHSELPKLASDGVSADVSDSVCPECGEDTWYNNISKWKGCEVCNWSEKQTDR